MARRQIAVNPSGRTARWFSVIPGWSARTRPQMCAGHRGISRFRVHRSAMPRNDVQSRIPPRRLGAGAEIGGPEIVSADIRQLAFEAFDVEPHRAALAEQQNRTAAGRLTGVKL